MKISPDILNYYENNQEESRIEKSPLEFILTSAILDQLIDKPKSNCLDLGAGTGFYSLYLIQKGHQVLAIEPSLHNFKKLQQAQENLPESQKPLLSVVRDDHSWLQRSSGSFDSILMMGPLYHLFSLEERAQTLRDAFQLVSPGGKLIVTFLSRIGWLSHVFHQQPALALQNSQQIEEILQNGEYSKHPADGSFRGKFDSLDSLSELFKAAGVPLNQVIPTDPIGGVLEDEFRKLPEDNQLSWAQLFLNSTGLPETLGAAKTWITCSIK